MHASLVFILLGLHASPPCDAAPVRVRYLEGLSRGFMILRTEEGVPIAEGESSQILSRGIVSSHLIFHFKDGSLYDDLTTYTQNGTFRLRTNHLVQKGPSFATQMETWIDATSGRVRVHSEKEGKRENIDKIMTLPTDLANGLLYTLTKSLLSTPTATVSYLAFTPDPRIVKIAYIHEGSDRLMTSDVQREAVRFLVKVDLGGITGVIASIMNKIPPDTHMWVIEGQAPTFAGSEGPLAGNGRSGKLSLRVHDAKVVGVSTSNGRQSRRPFRSQSLGGKL